MSGMTDERRDSCQKLAGMTRGGCSTVSAWGLSGLRSFVETQDYNSGGMPELMDSRLLLADDGLGEGDSADGVGIGAEPDGLSGLMVEHMPDCSATTFDLGDTDDLFGFRIKPYQTIGM